MKRNCLIRFLGLSVFLCVSVQVHAGIITESLRRRSMSIRQGETVPIVVTFRRHPDYSRFHGTRGGAEAVIRSLREAARLSQSEARTFLAAEHLPGAMKSFWINNTMALEASPSVITRLNELPDVSNLDVDDLIAVDPQWSAIPPVVAQATTVPWNISRINADSVWLEYGLNGSGVLIGMMDTGIDTSHPAIAGRWRGGAHSWFDAINNRAAPYDDLGHGVATTGVVVGGDGPGPGANDIGIAYNARFITAKMLSSGFSTVSQITSAAQWMLDPDNDPSTDDFPSVINNSWFSNTRGSTYFYSAAAAWRAAGIIPVFIAGNSGPDTGTTRSPGDYDNCLSIGGTNGVDGRYAATSVGPSAAGPAFPSDRRKPDFSAPGELVVTSTSGGGYGEASGTSFSAPHVTGTIALMLQADSSLRYADVDSILRRASADLGAEGYDHVFGYGRIDALKAVRLTLGRRVRAVPDSVLVTTPTGGSATCSVSLAVAPTADVTLSLVSSDPSQGEPFPVSIVFSSMNWNTPQEIVITGRGDPDATLDVPYSVIMTSSSQDRLYDNILPAEIRLINRPAGVSGVREEGAAPGQFALAQNYPNPFNPTTTIRYRLTTRSRVTLKVYDVLDREVATLVSRVEEPGYKAVQFDAGGLASGVYFYRMQAGSLVDVKKLVVLR